MSEILSKSGVRNVEAAVNNWRTPTKAQIRALITSHEALRERVNELEHQLWRWSRGLHEITPYSQDALREMLEALETERGFTLVPDETEDRTIENGGDKWTALYDVTQDGEVECTVWEHDGRLHCTCGACLPGNPCKHAEAAAARLDL